MKKKFAVLACGTLLICPYTLGCGITALAGLAKLIADLGGTTVLPF